MGEVKRGRKVGKASTLPTAPAYTWPKAKERVKNDPGPGPGQYDSSIKWNKGIGFGSSARYKRDDDVTPSPMDYKPTDVVLKSQPGYSFRTKGVPEHLKNKNPGPGQYQPEPGYDVVKPSTPSFSLTARGRTPKDSDNTPAPNEYNSNFQGKEVHGVTLKFRHSSSHLESSPSPLDYSDFNFHRPASQGKSFGTSRDNVRLDNFNPGPGNYHPEIDASSVKHRALAWTMPRSVRTPDDNRGVPGPGTYLHEPVIERHVGHGIRSDNRSAPAFSVSGKTLAYAGDDSPGPLDYGMPKDPRLKTPPAFSFRGVSAKDSDNERSPGPGAYKWDSSFSTVHASAPSYSLAPRREDPALRDIKPGPAEYTLSLDSKRGVSLKFRHQRSGKDSGPSPLDYADKDFRQIYGWGYPRKGITFGMKPMARLREQTPGPIYQVGCTTLGIAAAPLMTQQELDQIAVL